ncbi:MAG TPA: hypothetical protein VFU23_13490, partial [Gemmatimonadales bacterium]|nr:hypothetical protein [Gemmatimonadales bacterium]
VPERAVNRRGIALLLAISVSAALGMISLTAFGLARMERAAGLFAVAEVQARGAAEAALADALAGWPRALTPLSPGQESLLASVQLPGPASGQAVVRALGGPVLSIRARGVRSDAGGGVMAEIILEQLVRLDSTAPDSLIHTRKYPLGWRVLP